MEGGRECGRKREGTPQSAEAPMAKAQRSTCRGDQGGGGGDGGGGVGNVAGFIDDKPGIIVEGVRGCAGGGDSFMGVEKQE